MKYIARFLLIILKQICGDDCAAKRKELKKWAMYV